MEPLLRFSYDVFGAPKLGIVVILLLIVVIRAAGSLSLQLSAISLMDKLKP